MRVILEIGLAYSHLYITGVSPRLEIASSSSEADFEIRICGGSGRIDCAKRTCYVGTLDHRIITEELRSTSGIFGEIVANGNLA